MRAMAFALGLRHCGPAGAALAFAGSWPSAGGGHWPGAAARGSRPAGGYFLLLAQKKVTKEEGLEINIRFDRAVERGAAYPRPQYLTQPASGSARCQSIAVPYGVRERRAVSVFATFGMRWVRAGGTASPSRTSQGTMVFRSECYPGRVGVSEMPVDKRPPLRCARSNRMLSEDLLFGYFLVSQQEKVTAGGARPARYSELHQNPPGRRPSTSIGTSSIRMPVTNPARRPRTNFTTSVAAQPAGATS